MHRFRLVLMTAIVSFSFHLDSRADMEAYFGFGARNVDDDETRSVVTLRLKGGPAESLYVGNGERPKYIAYLVHEIDGDYTEAYLTGPAIVAFEPVSPLTPSVTSGVRFGAFYYRKDDSIELDEVSAYYPFRAEARDDMKIGSASLSVDLFGVASVERMDGAEDSGFSNAATAQMEMGNHRFRIGVDGKIRWIGSDTRIGELGIEARALLTKNLQLILRQENARLSFDNGEEESETESDRFIVLVEYLPNGDEESFVRAGWGLGH